MFTTYKMMSSVVSDDLKNYDVQDLVVKYKNAKTESERTKSVAIIFCKFFPLILRTQKTYVSLSNEQRVETCLCYLYYSLEGYKLDSKVKFITYCIGNINRGLQTAQSALNCQNRKVWLNMVTLPEEHLSFILQKIPDKSTTTSALNLVREIQNSTLFTEAEKKYCLSILYGYKHTRDIINSKVTNPETHKLISKEMNQIRTSVRKKLKSNNFSFS